MSKANIHLEIKVVDQICEAVSGVAHVKRGIFGLFCGNHLIVTDDRPEGLQDLLKFHDEKLRGLHDDNTKN